MPYLEDEFFIEWRDELRSYFYPAGLDDIGRLDNSAYDYLISLNKNNESLASEEIDSLLEEEHAHFMEVMISRDKLLATLHFWKYPKGSGGQRLDISERPFLKKHKRMKDKFVSFARKNNIMILDNKALRRLVPYKGEMVSIYYKYFDDGYESTREIPF